MCILGITVLFARIIELFIKFLSKKKLPLYLGVVKMSTISISFKINDIIIKPYIYIYIIV